MAQKSVKALALRSLLGGFAIGTAAMLSIGQTGAQAFGGQDTNAPVNFGADRIELQDRQDRVVLAGNVDIAQGDLRLRAERTTMAYSDAGELKLHRIDATGGVVVTRGNQSASGAVAIYDLDRRIITLAGNVTLRRGSDVLNGGRLVIDLDSGVASIDGRGAGGSSAVGAPGGGTSRGRITGTFSVPKRSN
jgi:lipopolysaccharide export system protein LptA